MNRWQTEVLIKKPPFFINLNSSFYLIGSCFSEHIQKALSKNLFSVSSSPFGIEYNPISMAKGLTRILDQKPFLLEEVIHTSSGHSTWYHHSKFNQSNSQELLTQINKNLKSSLDEIKKCDFICITLGTAFYYYLNDSQMPVNNCHKMPTHLFSRKSATIEKILNEFGVCLENIKSINPKVNFIFTLSPVKHLRDDPTENSYSKAICRCAIEELVLKFKENSFYFPAYEILQDELRDYRYYDSNMTHPSLEAVQFIISKFFESILTPSGKDFLKEWTPILKYLEHKPENSTSTTYQNSLQIINNKILNLKTRFPQIDWQNFSTKF
jgi:hypothetical protein